MARISSQGRGDEGPARQGNDRPHRRQEPSSSRLRGRQETVGPGADMTLTILRQRARPRPSRPTSRGSTARSSRLTARTWSSRPPRLRRKYVRDDDKTNVVIKGKGVRQTLGPKAGNRGQGRSGQGHRGQGRPCHPAADAQGGYPARRTRRQDGGAGQDDRTGEDRHCRQGSAPK